MEERRIKTRKILTICIVIILILAPFQIQRALAAGVNVTISPSEVATADNTNKIVSFTPATAMTNGSTITVTYDTAYNDSALTNGDISITKTGDANFTSGAPVVNTTNNTITITLTTSGTLDTTNGFAITIGNTNKLVAPGTAGNYTFSVTTSAGDYGAVLQYVGDDNDVTVTATVTPVLTFAIRTSDDTGDTNVCNLGTLTLTAVNTCAYRLKIGTNSASGYTVQITSDAGLDSGANDINAVAENATVTAGNEQYGIALNAGSTTGGTITESGDFNDDDTPIPTVSTNLYTSNGTNQPASTDTTNTALVTHRVAINAGTSTGNYQQIVTYYVSASF